MFISLWLTEEACTLRAFWVSCESGSWLFCLANIVIEDCEKDTVSGSQLDFRKKERRLKYIKSEMKEATLELIPQKYKAS